MFKQLKKLFSTDKKLAKRHPKVLQYEELEPRVLFSADYMPGLDNIAVDQQVVFQDIGGNYQVEREAAPETVEQKAAEERLELVIVSEDVADYKHLIDDLQAGDDNRVIEVVVLESDRDGIEQVSEILAERSDVAAVHFITHGADGQINLGDTWLDSTTLAENSDAVAGWGKSLTETGDILFYGCNIAVDGDGQTLLDNIANLTGADVAASDDPTGSSKQGGDWDLEFSTGAIDTDLAPSLVAQQEWTHQMALETVRDNFSSISYSNNNGSTSWSGPWVETDGQGGGASGGNILVSSSCLYLHAEEIGDGIYRQANLAGAGTATLTFDIQNGLGVDDVIRLEISGNGGGSWNMLKDYSSANSGLPLSESFDISLYAAADTQIRFRYLVANGDDNPVLVDNIQIEYGDAPNTAPVNTVPGVQNTPVDTALEFSSTNGNAISINDIDAGSNPVEVTLTATNGTLTLDWPTGGTAITDGGETAANSTTTGSQVYDTDSPQTVAVADDGSYVVVWSGNGLGDADGVFFQRFDASGTAVGNETLVNVVTTGAQTAPAIGMDGDGNFVVVWQSDDGDGQGIFARCFDSSGSELSGEITVNSDPAEEQEEPSIAVARDGSFVVAWTDEETQGTKQDVFARIFDSSGTAQGLQFQVNGHTSLNQYHVAVAIDDAGNFVIAWGGVSATDNDGISARGFDASGAETIAEFQVNSTTTSAQFRPSVGMDAAGNFVVAWMGFEQPDPAPSVIARGFDANGTETMAEFPVTETTVNSQQQPAIAMDADGDFVIVWTADGQDGDAVGAWNTYARQFTANGSPKTGETLVNSTTTAGDQLGASVGMNDHGDFVVTWTGSGIGDTDGVFSQRYTVPTGLAYTSGSGINDTTMTFTGTITDINEALDGLTFTPDNGFIGMAGVQIDVNDLGYTGDGGALQDTDTVDITVGNPNTDSDGDGLWDNEEDANTDLDSDPSTNPGPDTDGDTFANYLDADDDGDGTPTSLENADPNSDGDPRDAVDSDHDGQPDYLDAPTGASDGTVVTEQKISDTTGGLTATLDDDDRFGTSVASIGDLDGDGINDIVVGAQYDDDGGTNRGAVHVLFLNADGTVKAEQKISDVTGGLTTTLDDSDIFGVSVALIGDLDSDGINDIAVGALNDDDGGTNRGAVHILFLNADGTVKAEQKISDTVGGLTATLDDSDGFGITVTGIGDLDGDGINDIAVGAFLDDDGGTDRGAVHVLFLNADGTVKAELKISDTTGGLTATLDDSDLFGVAVAGIGDLDGDGVNDLAVGAEWDDDGGADRGAVHILFLNADGTVKAELKISDTTGGLTATLDNEDYFGNDIAGIGDLNGDGINDIAVSAMFDDDGGTDRGAVHLLFLNADGTVKAEQKISDTAGGLTAALDNTDRFGISVAGIGDLDGDGAIDIAVGAQLDDDGGADRGAVYVLNLAAVNTAPTLSSLDGSPTFVEDGAAVVLDGNVDASDGELDLLNSSQGNYAGASLTLVRNGGASAEDVFVFNDGNGITLSGGNLIKNAQIIASFDIATTPGELVVSFTDAGGEIPTSADLDNILRQIAYANSNDTPPASVQIDWTFDDGNAGAQGTGGALTATGSTTATITAVNDAPVLDISGSMTLTTITEDETNNSGDLVSAIIASAGGDRITDADAGAVEGIAILGFSSGNGTWQYDIGSGWTAVGSVSDTSSLLLRATDSLRFVPDGLNADTAFVTFAAWDQTSGTAGTKVDTSSYGGTTPFSATVESPTITVTAINDDPTTVGIADVTVDEDAADSVVDLFAAFADVEDLDSALTYTITNNTNPGLFTATTIDGGAGSLTLDYTADQNGAADITVRATDTGGQFVETTFTVTVNAVNDAPLLSGANNLTAIDEDPLSNNGTLVSELISGQATDPDADALSGIAVIGVDNTNGTWQYTTNGGGIWTAFGSPSTAAARLLAADANTYVRFVPNADWNGTVTNGITFHAWDQTSGTSGSPADLTSVYTLLDQFSVVSYSNNDGTASWTSDWIEANDDGVASTSNIRIENNKLHVDNLDGGTFSSITRAADLTAATTATLTLDYDGIREGVVGGDRFTVEISDDGGGTWTLLEEITVPGATTANLPFSGSLSYTLESAVTLTNNMVIRLSISAGFGGTDQHVNFDNVQIQYTVIDQIGGSTAFSTVTASSSITVNPVNDAPTAANSTVTTDEDTTYTFSAGDFNFSDIDGDTLASVKITSLEAAGNLQLSGGDVTLNQVITRADIDADNLKFIPVADANGAGYDSFGFSVNDGTVDSAASYTMTINVTAVNDAPILLTDSVNNLTVLEDSGFTSLDLSGVTYGPGGGSDESTQTLTYEVTTIPDPNSFGKIYLADGTTQVTTGFYTLAEIQGMQFKPEPNENGGPSFFSYRVQDSGGTANGGNDILVESIQLDITPVADAPIITSDGGGATATLNIDENLTTVTTVTSTDSDGDTPLYSISAGVDAARFSINSSTGVLTFNSAPDFEAPVDSDPDNVYEVTVQVADGYGGFDTQEISVSVTNINDNTPVITSNGGGPNASISIAENTSGPIANVDATDADGGSLTYSISGGDDAAHFSIDAATGILSFVAAKDYEAPTDVGSNNSYNVNVTASDGTFSDTQAITVNVTDGNDAPVLDNSGDMTLTTILENHTNNPGDLIANVITSAGGDRITDQDSGAVEGIAVISVDDTFGTWQYSTDGGSVWIDFGNVSDLNAVVLSASDRIRFSPALNASGLSAISFRAWDGSDSKNSGTTAVNTTSNGGSTPFSSNFESASIEITPIDVKMIFTTNKDVINSGAPNLQDWTSGTILGLSDPNLQFEDGAAGTLSSGSITALVNFDDFAADNDVDIRSMNYVSSNLTVGGGGNTINLVQGDILFTTSSDETLTSTNMLAFTKGDVIVYRPDAANDYSSGTFIHLLDNPSSAQVTGLTLVEVDITVGDRLLRAGEFLFTENSAAGNNIYHFTADAVGAGTTSGTVSILIDGNNIGMGDTDNPISGVMLIADDLPLSGHYVTKGSLITSLTGGDASVGDNSIDTSKDDFFYLTVNTTGEGTTSADATLLFEGADMNMDKDSEKFRSITFIVDSLSSNRDPKITSTGSSVNYTENDPATIIDNTLTVSDVDSANFDGGILSIDFNGTGTLNDRLTIENQGFAAGQVGIIGSQVFYSNILVGNFSGGTDGTLPLTINLNASATVPAVQGVLRAIAYENVSDNPDITARTVRLAMTDGDGGTSNTSTTAINITSVNDEPSGTDNTVTTLEDTAYTFTAADFNFSDVEGDTLVSVKITSLEAVGSLQLSGGDVTLNQVITRADIDAGNLKFVPVADANGAGYDSFGFSVNDGTTNSASSYTMTIDVNPVNDTPTTSGIADVTVDEDAADSVVDLFAAFADVEDLDSALTYTITNNTNPGLFTSTTIDGVAGSLTLNYAADQNGSSDITVRATDTGGQFVETTFTVTVNAINDTPTIEADIADQTITEDFASYTIDLNAAFDDVETTDANLVYGVSGNTNINVSITDGIATITNTADWNGSETLTFTATDQGGLNVSQDVGFAVSAVTDIVNDTAVPVIEDTATVIAVLANDSFEGTPVITATSAPTHGAVVINGGNTVTYTPDTNYTGADSFTYTVTSGGVTETATVTVNVTAVNDTPTIEADIADQTITEDFASYTIDLNAAFDDVETTDANLVYGVSGNTNINVSITDGIATITNTADWNGSETLTFTATDQGGLNVSQDVGFAVSAVTDIVNDTAVPVIEDTATVIAVLANDSFEGTPVITATSAPTHGAVVINGGNTVTYTPDTNYTGADSFTYTVTSGGVTETATVTVNVTAVNDTPTIEADIADQTITEDFASYTIDLNAAFDDVETTDANLVYGVSGNTNINVSITDGIATITNTADWNGSETLTFTATDQGGLNVSQDVGFAVSAVTDIVNDTAVPVIEDTATVIAVLANDSFEGTPVITATSAPTHGAVVINGGNTVTYTPDTNYTGADSFTYTVTSGGVTETATVTVNVTAVNDTPTIEADIADQTITEDFASYTIDLNAAFDDVETTDANLVYGVSGNTNINVSITDGIATITNTADWNGSETLTFTATDQGGLNVSQDVGFAVSAVTDIVNDTAVPVIEDTATVIAVLANDSFEGTPVITATSAPTHGAVVINGGNTVTYTPDTNYTGADSFTYTVTSGGVTETATVTVNVTAVNDTPTIEADIADQTITEDFASYTIDLNAAFDDVETTDANLVYGVSGNTNINVSITDGIATITNTADWNGSETLTFTATDQGGLNVSQDVGFAVSAVTDIVNDTAVPVIEDTATVIAVLANDSFEGTPVITATSAPTHGAVVINGGNTVTYTPDTNYTGADSFTYTVTSGGVTETATVTVNVTAVNDTPTIEADIADQTITEDFASYTIDLNAAFDDVETTDANLVYGVSGNTNINVSITDGIATITNTADWNGSETLTFTATDQGGLNVSQDVGFAVSAVTDIVNDTAVPVIEDTATVIAVLANDSFEGTPVITATSAPTHGAVVINGGNTVTYTPDTNYTGADSFTYTVTSGGVTETATVTVNVTAVNDTPTIEADIADQTITEDFASYTIDLNAAFDDVETTDANLVYGVSGNTNINVSITDGIATITNTADWNGSETLTFTATDQGGLNVSQDVGFAVSAVTDIVNDTAVPVIEDTATVIAVLANDSFEGTPVITATSAPTHGAVVINGGNTVTYTPDTNYTGADSFTYTVTSGGVTETATVTVNVTAVNDTPTIEADIADQTITEDFASYTIDLNAAFDDVETTDANLVYGVSGNTNINVSITDGIATITNTADWNGSETLTFTATDQGGLNVSQDVGFAVSAVTDIVNDTAVPVIEDTATVIAVLANDSFEGTPVITATSAPTHGAVVINGGNTVTYTPDTNYTGADSFTYTVTSGGVTETATVTVNVTAVNDTPTIEADIADQTITEDFASYTIDLNAAFDDVETTDANLVYGVSGNTNINVSITDGIATITNTADWNGSETLTFTATDQGGLNVSQDVGFAVSAVTDIVNDTAVPVIEDTATVIAVLANDSFEGTPVITATSAPTHGAVVINGGNTVTYTPDTNYTGADSFTYTVTSGGVTETATVTVNVTAVNDTPTIEADIADQTITEDFASYTIDLNAAFDDVETTDANLVYGVSGNTNINVSITDGIATITNTADWNGSETLTFTATDQGGLNVSQDVGFAVSAVTDIVNDTAVPVIEDTATVIAVLANDSFEGTPVITATSAPTHGAVVINGGNTVTYTPDTNYTGADSFTYTVTSGGVTETATVTVNVTAVNDTPTIEADIADQTITEDFASYTIDLNAAFDDVETTDANLVYGVSGNTNINVSITDGIATITNTADWNGSETLTFTATDQGGLNVSQDVGFAVSAVTDIVNDTAVPVIEDTATVIAVLANDSFEGTPVITATSAPTHGAVVINGGNTVTYTPDTNYTGADSFTYTVTSGGVTETATVTVNVTAVNDTPTIEADIADQTITEDFASYTIDLNAAFDDVETTDANLVYGVSGNTNINVSITDGIATITNTADWNGSETLTFTATDQGGLNVSQDVGFAVSAVTDIVNDTAVPVIEDTATVIAVLANDSFEGTPVITATSAPTHGAVVINGGNTVTYTPDTNYTGADSFTYTVTSGGVTETATVTVNVTAVNDTPTIEADIADQTITEDFASYTIDLNAAFDDVETTDANLVYGVSGNTNINVSITDGIATITNTADWNGSETLTFTATDQGGLNVSQDVGFAVSAVTDIVNDTAVPVIEDTATVIAVLANDSFEGTPVITATSAPTHGAVVINGGNTVTYTPDTNYTGADSFTYTVTSGGVTETATVTVNVTAVNDTPTIEADIADQTITEDFASYTIDLNAAFDDVETTDANLVYGVSGNTNINVSITDGIATITNTADWNGSETLTFTATDQGGLNVSQDVGFAVSAVTDIVNDTAVPVIEDTATVIAVLANDSFEGTPVITATSAPTHGAVVINGGNTVTYTPDTNYTGADSFTYTVTSGGVTETATVTVNVTAVNDTPTIEADIADQTITEDFASYTIDLNAAFDDVETTDANLVYGVSGNTNINVSITDGIATITNTADWNGSETLTFTATDQGGLNVSQDVGFAVSAVTDIVNDTAVPVIEDTATVIAVLANDSFEGTPVITATSAPTHGAVVINGGNTVTYTPDTNYTGADSFTYTVTSGGVTETATVTVNVTAVNDTPTIEADIADQTITEDFASYTIDLNAAFDDVETTDANLVYGVSGNTNINVSITDGIATITNTADWNGSETLTFTATDQGGLNVSQDVGFAVSAVTDIVNDTAVPVIEDTATVIAVLANDSFEGTPVITATSAPTHGAVVINGGNTVTYTPDTNYTGADSFTYTVTSGGVTETATVTVNVTAVNDTPTIEADIADQTITEDFASYTIDLNAAFDDVETTDANLVYGVSGNTNINVSITDGIATITNTADWNGSETLTFTATDQGGLNVSQDVGFAVSAVTDIVNDTAVPVIEDTATVIAVLANDSFEGTPVITATSAPTHGAVVINGGNTVTYTPDTNYTGADSFTYTVTSGGVTETATVTVNVTAVNDTPTIEADIADQTITEDFASYTIDLNAAFDDVETTDANLVYGVSGNTNINVSITDGIATITNTADWNGSETLTFTATDQGGLNVSQDVGFAVSAVTDIVNDTAVPVIEDTATVIAVLANDSFEGTPVITATSAPTHGAVVINGGNTVTYTPDTNYTGADSFTYTVTSGGVTETATVTVNVTAVNDTPTIEADIADQTITEDFASYTIDLNAAFDDVETTDANLVYGVSGNTNINVSITDGIATITNTADWNGSETLTFTATDQGGLNVSQDVGFAVSAVTDIVNDTAVPVIEDTATVIAVLANDSFEGTPVITATSAPTHGAVVINGGNTVTYTPDTNYTGADSFTYTVTSGGVTETATVTVNVTAVNDAPVAVADSFTVNEGSTTNLNLASNDTDSDDGLDLNSITIVSGPSNGTIDSINADGTVDYTHNGSETISDSFTYTIDDLATETSNTVTVSLTVTPVNDAPVASNDTISATEDIVFNAALPAATDADGDAVTYALETAAVNGTAVVNADGSFNYTPNLNSNAPDSFTYTVSDGNGGSNTYTVSINVTAVNDAPNVLSNAVTAATENAAYSYTITTSDVDGDVLTITATALPAWLTLVDNGDGTATLSGTPANADVGDHIVELQIFDGALIDIQDFTVTVSGATTDDGDSDLKGSTNPDPEAFENPESDNEQGPGVELPTPEDQPQDPVIEDEPAPPVEESLTPQGAADGDAQLVPMQDPEIEENEEIIDLTDEIDPDSLAENHGYDSSYTFFENDLYKEIHPSDYLALDYTAFDGPIPIIEEGFSILDLDSDDANLVDLNENYDLHRQEIDESFNTEQKSQGMRANIVSITAASFAAGFISYLLRAGSLVANLMSTLPLWRGFDPIVIFSGDKKKKKEKDRKDIPKTNEAKSETLFDDKVE